MLLVLISLFSCKKEFTYNENNLASPIIFKTKPSDKDIYFSDEGSVIEISKGIEQINASSKLLSEKELKNFKKKDLEVIRKTIYARHGLIFKSSEYSRYFNATEWYSPLSENVDSKLTSIEISNIELLIKFEKYANENYNSHDFGR